MGLEPRIRITILMIIGTVVILIIILLTTMITIVVVVRTVIARTKVVVTMRITVRLLETVQPNSLVSFRRVGFLSVSRRLAW